MSALLASDGAGIGILVIVGLALLIFEIAALWHVFVKAGQPGWAAIIPIYNVWILLKVIGRPGWWLLLFLLAIIPLIGSIFVLVISIIINIDLAKSFNKGSGFAVGLIFLSFIFVPILGF